MSGTGEDADPAAAPLTRALGERASRLVNALAVAAAGAGNLAIIRSGEGHRRVPLEAAVDAGAYSPHQ